MPDETPVFLPEFELKITPSSSSKKILLMTHIMGEWDDEYHSKGIIFQRTVGGGTPEFIRPPPDLSNPGRGRVLADFNITLQNVNSTMETCSLIYVDEPKTTTTITYKIFLVNTFNANANFRLNSTLNSAAPSLIYEVGSSTFTVEEK